MRTRTHLAVEIVITNETGNSPRIMFNNTEIWRKKHIFKDEGNVLSDIQSGKAGLEFFFDEENLSVKLSADPLFPIAFLNGKEIDTEKMDVSPFKRNKLTVEGVEMVLSVIMR